ncbi:MAG: hypothetical protein PHE21_03950 [Candidatus Dojkabacteria bacterium]|nr:hypothetical protein [Candidatus Dojkabacteria bacterium]
MRRLLSFVFLFFVLFLPLSPILASGIGVGVGSGKITINDKLKNGMVYKFPDLIVINTGDRESNYMVGVSYNQDQKELLPPQEWFTFTPDRFFLNPGESQNVAIKLRLPIDNVVPGDYFAYLEASPVIDDEDGVATVGIAAAAKLTFTIAPSNFIEGIFYSIKYAFEEFQPWSIIIVSILGLSILRTIFVKFFSFDLRIKPKKKVVKKSK